MPSPPELLATVPLFGELDADDLSEVAEVAHVETFAQGEHIFEIGEPGRSLFIVTEGTVQVHTPNRETHFELAQFGPGDFFGEMALLNDAPRSATVRALGAVEALVLDKVDFHRLITGRPDVALKVLEAMSIRIRNADEQIAGLTSRAVRDPLTGLLNKQAFNDRLQEEIERSRRYGGSFSLILVDFDNFGEVNDRVGVERADEVLAWAGRMLTEHTRGADVPFRFEDDKFTIICPWTAAEFATIVADRMVKLLSESRTPIEDEIEIVASAGTATCPSDGEEAHGLYHTAQRALLAAKS